MSTRVLYLSHTGMTEPLGQSQVLPYLRGLAGRGNEIEIISFEPSETTPADVDTLPARLRTDGLSWRPLRRSSSHAFSTKVLEASSALLHAVASAARRRPRIVHARSYLPAASAELLTTMLPGARAIFDCRGMLGDEYVDGGHWSADSAKYRLVKRTERVLFERAAGVVVLTETLRRWLLEQEMVPRQTELVAIPCCVDAARFRSGLARRDAKRRELGLDGRFVVVYSGTLGSWYLEQEMAAFAGALKALDSSTALLILSRAPTESFVESARRHGVTDVIVRRVSPSEMPDHLAAGDLGLSFIKPCFSKLGSSPTKVAEYLAAGLPVIVNDGIGDQGELRDDPDAAVVIDELTPTALTRAAPRALALARRPITQRASATYATARRRFDLHDVGVARYATLYASLCR